MPSQSRPDSVSVWGPRREWWVYQPGPRLGICLEEGVYDFVFHQKTYQFKSNMALSPSKHLTAMGDNYPWRAILIDYEDSIALLYTRDTGWRRPAAVWPMWSLLGGTGREFLNFLDSYPAADDQVGYFTGARQPFHAVRGQEQRVLIYNFSSSYLQWEPVFRDLMDAKRKFPHITFHATGQKSISRTLGTGIDSFDHPVTLRWEDNGNPGLLLANGRQLLYKDYQESGDHQKWAKLVGMTAKYVFEAPDRPTKSARMYLFNLRSLKWAFANYDQVWSMRVMDESEVDPDDPDSFWIPSDIAYRPRTTTMTDKWICDLCSISDRCPYSRPGAICVVDKTEAADLAKKFKTRSSMDIIDGLGTLLGAQTERAARAMQAETEHNVNHPDEQRFSPEVTKMLTATFDQATTLARLVDPLLGAAQGKGKKVINVGVATHALAQSNPKELASEFKRELESVGIDITKLTEEQAQDLLARVMPSGSVASHVDDDDEDPETDPVPRNPVAAIAPSFRATPRFDPGVPGT